MAWTIQGLNAPTLRQLAKRLHAQLRTELPATPLPLAAVQNLLARTLKYEDWREAVANLETAPSVSPAPYTEDKVDRWVARLPQVSRSIHGSTRGFGEEPSEKEPDWNEKVLDGPKAFHEEALRYFAGFRPLQVSRAFHRLLDALTDAVPRDQAQPWFDAVLDFRRHGILSPETPAVLRAACASGTDCWREAVSALASFVSSGGGRPPLLFHEGEPESAGAPTRSVIRFVWDWHGEGPIAHKAVDELLAIGWDESRTSVAALAFHSGATVLLRHLSKDNSRHRSGVAAGYALATQEALLLSDPAARDAASRRRAAVLETVFSRGLWDPSKDSPRQRGSAEEPWATAVKSGGPEEVVVCARSLPPSLAARRAFWVRLLTRPDASREWTALAREGVKMPRLTEARTDAGEEPYVRAMWERLGNQLKGSCADAAHDLLRAQVLPPSAVEWGVLLRAVLTPSSPRFRSPSPKAIETGVVRLRQAGFSSNALCSVDDLPQVLAEALLTRQEGLVREIASLPASSQKVRRTAVLAALSRLEEKPWRPEGEGDFFASLTHLLGAKSKLPFACEHLLAVSHSPLAVAWLLEQGADPNEKVRDPSLLFRILHADNPEDQKARLAVVKVLLDKGANVQAVNPRTGDSLLIHAVKLRDGPLVQLLLAHGATPSQEDRNGRNAASVAAELITANVIDPEKAPWQMLLPCLGPPNNPQPSPHRPIGRLVASRRP